MKITEKIKFPCGYEFFKEIIVSDWNIGMGKIEDDKKGYPVCPIHKEKCKKETYK